jgi:hypothetical protein
MRIVKVSNYIGVVIEDNNNNCWWIRKGQAPLHPVTRRECIFNSFGQKWCSCPDVRAPKEIRFFNDVLFNNKAKVNLDWRC